MLHRKLLNPYRAQEEFGIRAITPHDLDFKRRIESKLQIFFHGLYPQSQTDSDWTLLCSHVAY